MEGRSILLPDTSRGGNGPCDKFTNGEIGAIEVKRSITKVSLTKGFYVAQADLNPAKTVVIYQGTERFPIAKGIDAVNIMDVLYQLKNVV